MSCLPMSSASIRRPGRLQGELYCALASRIGAGERREAIVSVLSREFPAGKIDEAFGACSIAALSFLRI
jgi:hypothetical protein